MEIIRIIKNKTKFTEKIWQYLSSKEAQAGEYYFIIEGDYFCRKRKMTMLVLRARHQRNVLIRPIQEIVYNKDFIRTLCPLDTFVIGVLSNKDRNGFKEFAYDSVYNMRRLKNKDYSIKLKAILQITKINFDQLGNETFSIFSPSAAKEVSCRCR